MGIYDPTWSYGNSKLINSSGTTVTDGDDIWNYGQDQLFHEYTAVTDGTIASCIITSSGWVADITIVNTSTGGTYDFGLGEDNDPSSAKIKFTLTSEGYDNTGSLGTTSRTVYGIPDINEGALRLPYPNNNDPNETVDGSDVIIKVALSDFIYDDDTAITVDVGSGWYTESGTPNNATTGLSVTNNSTLDYTIPCGRFAIANSQIVTGNFDVEFITFHRHGTEGKPVAAVKITATDENTNSVTETVTDLTVSEETGDQSPVLVYKSTIDVSTMTDGDLITIQAQIYPWVGDADSVLDTNDGAYSIPTPMWTNLIFRLDKAQDHGWTVVDSGGNDSTGTVYSNQSGAEAGLAFLTIAAALTAVQAYNNTNAGHNDAGGGTLLLGEATWTLNSANGGTLTQWVTLKPKTGALKTNVIVNPDANSSAFPTYMKLQGITINTTYYWRGFNTDCMWHDDCDVSYNSGINLSIYQSPYLVMTNCTGDMASNSFNTFGANNTAWTLLRGNAMDDLEFGHLHCCVGNFNVGISIRLNDSNALNELGIYAFNICKPTNDSDFAIQIGDGAIDNYSLGFAIVQNLLVRYGSQAQAMVRISADSSTTTTNNIIFWYNTLAGARSNFGYNDGITGGPYSQVNWSMKGNIFSLYANKDDVFGENADATGGWPVGYGVGYSGNHMRSAATDEWFGEFQGLWMVKGTTAIPLEPDYVNDQSADGSDTSGGDYHLNGTAPSLALFDDYLLPFDLEGNLRSERIGDLGVYIYIVSEPESSVSFLASIYYKTLLQGGHL